MNTENKIFEIKIDNIDWLLDFTFINIDKALLELYNSDTFQYFKLDLQMK